MFTLLGWIKNAELLEIVTSCLSLAWVTRANFQTPEFTVLPSIWNQKLELLQLHFENGWLTIIMKYAIAIIPCYLHHKILQNLKCYIQLLVAEITIHNNQHCITHFISPHYISKSALCETNHLWFEFSKYG